MRRALAKFLFIILLPLKFIRSGKIAMEHNWTRIGAPEGQTESLVKIFQMKGNKQGQNFYCSTNAMLPNRCFWRAVKLFYYEI